MATHIKKKFGWQAQIARRISGKTVRKAKTFRTKCEVQIGAQQYEIDISSTDERHLAPTVPELRSRETER